jgi:hypothetical protein
LADLSLEAFEDDWQRQWLVERGVEIISEARAFSASMESKRGSGFFDLTRFLDANRFPLRLKTLEGRTCV